MTTKLRWHPLQKGMRLELRQGRRKLATIEKRPEGYVWFNAWERPCKPTDKLEICKSNAQAHIDHLFRIVDRAIERSNLWR